MGPRGCQDAMHVAGDVTELARRTSISQRSVSSWSMVPAERVLSVAAVMDVARQILWPDPATSSPLRSTMWMEQAEAVDFNRYARTAGRLFMEIEAEAFALPA